MEKPLKWSPAVLLVGVLALLGVIGCEGGVDESAMPLAKLPATPDLVVDTLADENDGYNVGKKSLREAITQANGTTTDDVILVQVSGVISLNSALPDITSNLTIQPGSDLLTVTIQRGATSDFRIFNVGPSVRATFIKLSLKNGRSTQGGAIQAATGSTLTLDTCVVTNNTATSFGGAITSSGTVNIYNSLISQNTSYYGSALATSGPLVINDSSISENTGTLGGAIYSLSGGMTINRSLFRANVDGNSGGIQLAAGELIMNNSTFSGNTGGRAGSLAMDGGKANLNAVTLVGVKGNSTPQIDVAGSASLKMLSTALSGVGCRLSSTTARVDSQGWNVVSDGSCNLTQLSDKANTDPALMALTNNGGVTSSHMPSPCSPVLNASASTTLGNVDQRGSARNQGGAIDVGAVESAELPCLSVKSLAQAEGSSPSPSSFPVKIELSSSTVLAVSGSVSTKDDTATSPSDYTALSSNFSLAAGVTSTTFTVPVVADSVYEPNEAFNVSVAGVTNAHVVDNFTAITIVNDDSSAPTVSNIPDTTQAEDSPLVINFSVGDPDTPVANLAVTATSTNSALFPIGSLIPGGSGANRTLTLTPAPNQNGSATVTVTVSDGTLSVNDTFLATVNSVNDAPTLTDIQDTTTPEDTPRTGISFVVGDVETAHGSLVVTATSSNQAVVADAGLSFDPYVTSTRTMNVTPQPNVSGSSTITVRVSDGKLSTTDSFVLTVTAVNDPPVLSQIADQTTDEDKPITVSFTLTDVDSITSLTVGGSSSDTNLLPNSNIVFSSGSNGRSVTLTPAPNQHGATTVTLTASDGQNTVSDTFVLTVVSINDAPTITTILDQNTPEDTPRSGISFTVGDLETAPNQLTVSAKSSNTTLLPDGNITITTTSQSGGRALSLTPQAQQSGSSLVTVSVNDGKITTSTSFTLTVTSVDDPPVLADLLDLTVDEDKTASTTVSFSDPDTATSSLTVKATSGNTVLLPTSGITLANLNNAWTLSLTPAADASGTVPVTVTVSDATQSVSDTFTLTVRPVNDPPTVTVAALFDLTEDTPGTLSFALQDVDSDVSTLTLSASASPSSLLPSTGLTLAGSGASRTLTVSPGLNQNGTGQITLSISDGVNTTLRNISVTVSAVNDAPTLTDIPNQASTPAVAVNNIPFTVGDVESSANTLTLTSTTSNTAVVPKSGIVFGGSGANRTVSVTPTATLGQSTLTITVSDGSTTTSDTFVFTVAAAVAPPTITSFVDQTLAEDGVLAGLTFTIGDPDTALSALVVTATSSNPNVVASSGLTLSGTGKDRQLTVVPVPNGSGSTTLTVSVSDGTSTTQSSFKLVVTPVNDPPTISPVADQTTPEDTPVTGLQITLSDVDNDVGTFGVSIGSSNTDVIPTTAVAVSGSGATRGLSVTPVANAYGSANITISVTDGSQLVSSTFKVTVTAVNDPPVMTPLSDVEMDEDDSTTLNFSVSDVETASSSLVLSLASSNSTLISSSAFSFGGSGKNRTLTLTPEANVFGTSTLTVHVSDGSTTTDESFVLRVNPVNDAPTVSEIADVNLSEDQGTTTLPFTVGDLETPVDELAVSVASDGSALLPPGSVVLGGQGEQRTLSITTAPNTSGSAKLTLSVGDGGLTTVQEVLVTVNGRNDPPVLSGVIDLSTREDEALTGITLVVDDPDTSLSQLTLSGVSSDPTVLPTTAIQFGGSGANRTLSLTPAPDTFGEVEVTLTLSDGDLSVNGVFTFTITAVNDAPSVSALKDLTLDEDTPATVLFTVGDVDNKAGDLQVTASSSTPLFGSSGLVLGGSGSNRSLTLTPNLNESGKTTVSVSVGDGQTTTRRDFVVTVGAVDDPPEITSPGELEVEEDTDPGNITIRVSDVETPADLLVLQAFSLNEDIVGSGEILLGGSGGERILSFTPRPNAHGDVYLVLLVDDGAESASADLLVHVLPVEDDPISVPDSYEVDEDVTLEVTAQEGVGENDSDADGDSLLYSLLQHPISGEVDLLDDGSFTYVPNPNFSGDDTFSYAVVDETGRESTAEVWVEVLAVNDAPRAQDDLYGTVVGRTLVVYPGQGLLANDVDFDGDTLAVAIESGPTHGEVVLLYGGGFEWTPDAKFVGEDHFTYAVVDPGGLTSRAEVTLIAAEGDRDEDGIPDEVDICPDTPDPEQIDQDGDGIGDVCDDCPGDLTDDGDGDGLCGEEDNCPGEPNQDQRDGDGDGLGDVCDVCPADAENDADRDEICGDVDVCPDLPDPDQTDTDGDGIGDLCDDDNTTPEPTERPTQVVTEPPTEIPTDGVTGEPSQEVTGEPSEPVTEEPDTSSTEVPSETPTSRPDGDGDEIPDGDDNCPDVPNSDQVDTDDDGEGDACEAEVTSTPEGTPESDNDDRGCGCDARGTSSSLGQLLLLLPVLLVRRRSRN